MAWYEWIIRKRTAPVVTPKRTAKVAAGSLAATLAIAIPFVAAFEGYFPRVYRDSVGVKTICYGQTSADGADFSKVYTKAECENMLGRDLARYDRDLQKHLTPAVYAALQPNRHAALISFDYNLGAGNLARIAPYFNRGDWKAGCHAMLAYNHAGGRVLAGLTRRRQAEYKLCMRSD
jgi:lysozyme